MKMSFKTLAAFCAFSLGLTAAAGCASDSPQSSDDGQNGILSNATLNKTDISNVAGYNASVKAVAAPTS